MGIPQQTDERLRGWLDTNQLARERLCQAILSLDRRFIDVRPRHPRGGPDGGRDLEALFEDDRLAFGAVGFLNSVSDSPEDKKAASKKFTVDLAAALESEPTLKVFVFFTNVSLTIGEKKALEDEARKRGIEVVDIFDRERLRIALDSTDGLAARYQYLGIRLSDAEQASFFARWGREVEQLTTGSSTEIGARLNRLEFIHERTRPLHSIHFGLKFSREVTMTELPHIRALMAITFAPITSRLDGKLHMLVCNDHGEWHTDGHTPLPGGTGQVGYSWGRDPRYLIQRDLYYQNATLRGVSTRIFASAFGPAIMGKQLGDLDHGLVKFFANKILGNLVTGISVIANQYIIWKTRSAPTVEESDPEDVTFPLQFAAAELHDPWVELKADITSGWFDFSRFTPRRLFRAEEITSGF